jgi:hypothetical protein
LKLQVLQKINGLFLACNEPNTAVMRHTDLYTL